MKTYHRIFFILTLFCAYTSTHATPPVNIPEDLMDAYTMNGQIPVHSYYWDSSYPPEKPLIYTPRKVNSYVKRASQNRTGYYGKTDSYLYEALDHFSSCIRGKDVAILGSVKPWYEAIVISRGGNPYTIEYNKIVSTDPRIITMTVAEFEQNPRVFDALVSISSYEHDGLGRYGDPIDPIGDLKAMQNAKKMLNAEGVLFLAVPVGKDALYWNAHRIYGALRLPLLLQGWEILQSFGFSPDDLQKESDRIGSHQPVFVLKPIF